MGILGAESALGALILKGCSFRRRTMGQNLMFSPMQTTPMIAMRWLGLLRLCDVLTLSVVKVLVRASLKKI
jgi:hypothetical protein